MFHESPRQDDISNQYIFKHNFDNAFKSRTQQLLNLLL